MSPVRSSEHRGLASTAALSGGLARPAPSQFGDLLRQPIDVDNVGIEVVDEPFFQFAMALVFGIGHGFEKLNIASRTPTSSGGQWLLASINRG